MSRNKERAYSSPPQPPTQAPEFVKKSQESPFGISFVVPTESVELPSGGLIYAEDSPLHGVKTLEIKHMTSKEEDLLTNESFIRDGTVMDRLLESLLVRNDVSISLLAPGDKEALLYAARISGYGPEYHTTEMCEKCNEPSEFVYDLNKRSISGDTLPQGVTYNIDSKLYTFELPKTKIEVSIRILSTPELDSIEEHQEKKKKLNLPFSYTAEFCRLAIVSANDIIDRASINKLVDVLPTIDARKIKIIHAKLIPKLNTTQEVECGSCGQVTEREVPYSLGFFWPDI